MNRRVLLLFLATLPLAACHSPRIHVTVENRTGTALDLLEVDYPSASFGADHLASDASYSYGIQTRGSGPVRIQYTEPATRRQVQIAGTQLQEGQSGSLAVVLLPGGKAEFHPALAFPR